MDDFNNKYENENKNAETSVNETPAEPQAQQPNETAPQQTETPQAAAATVRRGAAHPVPDAGAAPGVSVSA